MKMYFQFLEAKNQHRIAGPEDAGFLFLLRQAVLLALKDEGHIRYTQLRQAEEALGREYPAQIRRDDD